MTLRTSARPRWTLSRRATWATLAVVAVVSVMVTASVGAVVVPIPDILSVLTGGDASDPGNDAILRLVRLPRIATSAIAGAALGVAGLQMQTLFRNALADPYILGANSGASLGVAIVSLAGGVGGPVFVGAVGGYGRVGIVLAAATGAAVVLGVILVMAVWVRNAVTLLLIGVMLGSVTGALVSVLIVTADPTAVQKYMIWGLGTFSSTSWGDLSVAAPIVLGTIGIVFFTVRPLNALLLGEGYARSMGVDLRVARTVTLLSAALLSGVVTAFCGPVGFLGLVIPHLVRGLLRTSDHRILIPGCALVGATLAVWCGALADLPGERMSLPLNAVTAIIGAPVVIAVLLRGRREGGSV
ncbi:Hemin transport system permease protein HmuU [Gordonia sp. MP11Mi]|uniref:Hemin transport system permease protein HmuU n=2 Tax=Gordonia sp. MP11Mi TaxID=3022769 RepID=A0AA97CUG7_9ACTN